MGSGGTQVASMYASLGLQINQAQWAAGKAQLQSTASLVNRASQQYGPLSPTAALRQAQRGNAMIAQARNASVRSQAQQYTQSQAAMAKAAKASQASHKGLLATFGEVKSGLLSVQTAIAGYVASIAGTAVYNKLIAFNQNVEDSRDKIAGMLSIAKHSDFTKELTVADGLMANLQRRAAALPGKTVEYVDMLSQIAGPVTDAKLSVQELEDITVGAVVAAKSFHIEIGQSARDVQGALRGQFNARDMLTRPLLEARGFKGEAGRARFNALSEARRAAEVKAAFTSPQLTAMANRQGKSFGGLLSTLEEAIDQFFARIGKPLFGALTKTFGEIAAWLDRHKATIDAIADSVGGSLATAFGVVKDLAMKLYGLFDRNRDVLMRIVGIVGMNLVAALKMMVEWFGAGMTAAETILRFLDTGTGKFLTMLAMTPGLLLEISEAVGGLGDMFDALAKSSAIQVLLFLAEKLDDLFGGGGGEGGGDMDELARARSEYIARKSGTEFWNTYDARPSLALPSGAMQGGAGGVLQTRSVSVSVGDIHVHSPSADPAAVATETRKQLDAHLTDLFRQTHDVVAGSR